MRITNSIAVGIFSAVVVAGCGGSDGGSTTAQSEVQPVVQSSTVGGNSGLSIDQPSVQPVAMADADGSVVQPGSGTEIQQSPGESGGSASVDTSSVSQVFPNSTCVPGATAVSYEGYSPYGDGRYISGVYVPYPASGFGWNGAEICDLEGSSGLDKIEVLVPYVKKRPDTDGVIASTEWNSAVRAGTYDYETRRNIIDNLLLSPVAGYVDGSGYTDWRAMHDGTNLYLYVRVANDGGQLVFDSDQPWQDDSIEIFIDGDNSKGEEFDGINDFQISLSTDSSIMEPLISQRSAPGLRIFYRSGNDYIQDIEITINLASAGIEIGKPFGFDVHVNEDDNGGDRDAKWGWFEKSGFDRSWYQPSSLATLLLTDCTDRNACGTYQVLSR